MLNNVKFKYNLQWIFSELKIKICYIILIYFVHVSLRVYFDIWKERYDLFIMFNIIYLYYIFFYKWRSSENKMSLLLLNFCLFF